MKDRELYGVLSELLGRGERALGRFLRRGWQRLGALVQKMVGDALFVLRHLLAWVWATLSVLAHTVWVALAPVRGAIGAVWARISPLLARLAPMLAPLARPRAPSGARLEEVVQPLVEARDRLLQADWRQRRDELREALAAWRAVAWTELRGWPAHEAARLRAWLRSGRWQVDGLVALALLFVSFWVTSPAWLLGATRYLIGGGENPDWTGTAWAYWWTGFAIEQGMNPYDGSWTFFPVGQRPVGQYNLLDGMLGAPLMKVFGPVLGYNAFALFTVWSTAMAMFVLGRSAGASRGAAMLAGIGLVSSNFFGFELRDGRLSQTLLVFWILGFAGLERLARGLGTWRLAVATGALVAATHLVYWYNGLFLLIAGTPLWAHELRRWDLPRFRRLGLAALITVLLCLPYIVSLAAHFRNLPGVARELEAWMNYGELGRGEFGLNSAIRHSHWPGWPAIHPFMEPDDHRIAIAVLVLAFVGLLFRGMSRGRWLAVAATGYVLTLGPYLKGYDGELTPIKLPYLLLYDHFPFFNRLWWPGRMALIFMVPVLVLAALHLDRLAARWPRRRALVLAAGSLAVLIDVDMRNAFVPIMGRAPEVYNAALYEALDGPIITTPVLGQDPAGRHHLWFQVYHQQPILYGLGAHISSHRPTGYEAYIKANGLLAALEAVSENRSEVKLITPSDIDRLASDGFRWAVVDPTTYTFDYAANYWYNFAQVFLRVWGQPDISSGNAHAWRVRPIPSTVTIPALTPAGPTEFGKAPVLPGAQGR